VIGIPGTAGRFSGVLVLVNKIDLVPHLNVGLERLLANIDAVHPSARCS
jgi:hypothetical protein